MNYHETDLRFNKYFIKWTKLSTDSGKDELPSRNYRRY